jgi:anti-sigma factor RsiW
MTSPEDATPEADWHRLLDGELGTAAAAELRARLAASPERQAWLSQVARDRDLLRARLEAVLHEPVPHRLSIAEIRRAAAARRRGRVRLAAAACLILGLGFASGWGGRSLQALLETRSQAARLQAIVADAATSYRTFSADPRFPVEVAADRPADLAVLISRGLGRKAPPPDLAALGFTLVGGRIVPSAQGRAVVILYASGRGEWAALYVKAGEPGDRPLEKAAAGGLPAYAWTDDDCAYVMAGDLPQDTLRGLAEAAFDHFERGPGAG